MAYQLRLNLILSYIFQDYFVQLDEANPSKCVYPEVIKIARSWVAELKAKESSRLWECEDMTYNNQTISSLACFG